MNKIKTALQIAVNLAKETETIHPEAVLIVERIIETRPDDETLRTICNMYAYYRFTRTPKDNPHHSISDGIGQILQTAVEWIAEDAKK